MRRLAVLLGTVGLLLMPMGVEAKSGCQTKACHARVAKYKRVQAAGVPWCHKTLRCVRRAYKRHPKFRWKAYAAPLLSTLEAIVACESLSSGGYKLRTTGNGFYFAHQFDPQTWASVGGRIIEHEPYGYRGERVPSKIEQNYRAALLYRRRGAQPWPVCGR